MLYLTSKIYDGIIVASIYIGGVSRLFRLNSNIFILLCFSVFFSFRLTKTTITNHDVDSEHIQPHVSSSLPPKSCHCAYLFCVSGTPGTFDILGELLCDLPVPEPLLSANHHQFVLGISRCIGFIDLSCGNPSCACL